MVVEQLGVSIMDALMSVLLGILQVIPGLIAAVIVLLVGYIIGWIVYRVLDKLFEKIKLDNYVIKKTGLKNKVGDLRLGHILAVISKWYIFILFLTPAASLVRLNALSNFLLELNFWIPSLIAALLIVLFGILAASYVGQKVEDVKMKSSKAVAHVAQVVIMVFIVLLALDQIGLKLSLAHNTFLIILGGIMLAFSLAVGIGYGLAMKETAKARLGKWKKML
ncbi:hypothetical protein HOC35_04350 [Candidatus Woesearchaeota archaeon]|jgi:hypothetical protein|nr:hypothetical protein [Candidatus Woesearchaeota archaeon]